jgi:hypothetical protein
MLAHCRLTYNFLPACVLAPQSPSHVCRGGLQLPQSSPRCDVQAFNTSMCAVAPCARCFVTSVVRLILFVSDFRLFFTASSTRTSEIPKAVHSPSSFATCHTVGTRQVTVAARQRSIYLCSQYSQCFTSLSTVIPKAPHGNATCAVESVTCAAVCVLLCYEYL